MFVQSLGSDQTYLLRVLHSARDDVASATLELATGRRVRSASDAPALYKLAARGGVDVANLKAERDNYGLSTYAVQTQALNLAQLRQSVTAIRSALVAAAGNGADKAALQTEIRSDGAAIIAGISALSGGAAKTAGVETMLSGNAAAAAPVWTASDRGFDVNTIVSPTTSWVDPRLETSADFIERVDTRDIPSGTFTPFWKSGPSGGRWASKYSGVIEVTTAGSYTFSLSADDHAYVKVNGVAGAFTDFYAWWPAQMTVNLSAGANTIEVYHDNIAGAARLDLEWQGPDSPTLSQLTGANVIATSAYNAKRSPVGVPSLYKEMGQILTYEPTDSTATVANLIASADRLLGEIISGETRVGSVLKRLDGRDQLAASLIEVQKAAISSAVDANLEETAVKLRAAQVRQSLAIRSLSIANQGGASVLKLFRN